MVRILCINLMVFIFLCLVLEGIYRIYSFVRPDRRLVVEHPTLSWVHNTKHPPIEQQNLCGDVVRITAPSHSLLNKISQNSQKLPELLFIGDSFTHAYTVGDNKAYFDLLEHHFKGKYAINAAGLMATGTTHQGLILEEILTELSPALIIWQLTGNDLENNVPLFDEHDSIKAPRIRPYRNLDDGSLSYKSQGLWLFRVSKLAYALFTKLYLATVERDIDLTEVIYQLLYTPLTNDEREAGLKLGAKITGWEIARIRQKYDIPIVAFSVDNHHNELYKEVFSHIDIPFYPLGSNKMFKPGVTDCMPDDHWNFKGNAIAAELLIPVIEQSMPGSAVKS